MLIFDLIERAVSFCNPRLFPFGGGSSDIDIGDNIANSLMLDSSSSQYLSRTPTSAGNLQTWTYSTWVKLGSLSLGAQQFLLNAGTDSSNRTQITIDSSMALSFAHVAGGSVLLNLTTSSLERDPSGWLHLGFVCDTTNATASDRARIYVNGVRVTSFTTSVYWAQNTNSFINSTSAHFIGKYLAGTTNPADCYLAKMILIEGLALDPSYFGRVSADTGQWVNKKGALTYGAGGSDLEFTNGAALGTDSSGNGNNWTLNGGITSANQFTDTPTNNYSVFDQLSTVTTATLTKGNTVASASAVAIGNIGMSVGRWQWEVSSATAATSAGIYGTSASATVSIAAGKTYGLRFDAAAGTLEYKNITDAGAWTSLATGLTSGPYFQYVSTAATAVATLNSGQRPLTEAVSSGYYALCSANLPENGTVITSGTFTGTLNANGPEVFCNGYPTTLTINGNAVTFGTHADRIASGFKLRTASASYNNTGSNTWTATIVSNQKNLFKFANAQGNP